MSAPVRYALVTGASRGIGAEIARALGEAGFSVAVGYAEAHAEAAEVVAGLPDGSFAVRADVSDRTQVAAMATEVGRRFGRLDVLVNNAGLARDALIVRAAEADWERVISVNLSGAAWLIRACLPLLEVAGSAHVVNVSSRSGLMGKAGQAAYSASKAGLIGLTHSLAAELGPSGVRVNAVVPGYVPTEMGLSATEAMDAARAASLLGVLGDAHEVGSFIAWLVSTRGVTGQYFVLDSRRAGGGW
jgi:3-oxoacyl-[acyl-carrier protein] reductase